MHQHVHKLRLLPAALLLGGHALLRLLELPGGLLVQFGHALGSHKKHDRHQHTGKQAVLDQDIQAPFGGFEPSECVAQANH